MGPYFDLVIRFTMIYFAYFLGKYAPESWDIASWVLFVVSAIASSIFTVNTLEVLKKFWKGTK